MRSYTTLPNHPCNRGPVSNPSGKKGGENGGGGGERETVSNCLAAYNVLLRIQVLMDQKGVWRGVGQLGASSR